MIKISFEYLLPNGTASWGFESAAVTVNPNPGLLQVTTWSWFTVVQKDCICRNKELICSSKTADMKGTMSEVLEIEMRSGLTNPSVLTYYP